MWTYANRIDWWPEVFRDVNVYFLKRKSDVFEKFKEFEAIVTNECGQNIGTLPTDNGGEYLSNEFQTFLKSKGIRHELTIPHTPEQNGVAERMNRTLIDSARAMVVHAGLSNSYWVEAVATAAKLRNRASTFALQGDTTPYQKWFERKPDVGHLRMFGCVAYAHIPNCERQKLDTKAKKLRFVDYCKNSKGYRLFDEETGKVLKRDVIFNETDFVLNNSEPGSEQKNKAVDVESVLNPSEEEVHQPQDGTQRLEKPRRSLREHRPPVGFGLDEFADTAKVDHMVYVSKVKEPGSIEEAQAGS